jgi:hypothetical protein
MTGTIRRSQTSITRPCEWVTRILLEGYAARLPPGVSRISDLPAADQVEVARLFAARGLAEVARLWTRHAAYLRRYARTHHITPTCSHGDKPVYFAQMVAATLAARGGRVRPQDTRRSRVWGDEHD